MEDRFVSVRAEGMHDLLFDLIPRALCSSKPGLILTLRNAIDQSGCLMGSRPRAHFRGTHPSATHTLIVATGL